MIGYDWKGMFSGINEPSNDNCIEWIKIVLTIRDIDLCMHYLFWLMTCACTIYFDWWLVHVWKHVLSIWLMSTNIAGLSAGHLTFML